MTILLSQEQLANIAVNFVKKLPDDHYLRQTYIPSLPEDHPVQVLLNQGKAE